MTGEGYLQSVRMGEALGPFEGYALNREPMPKPPLLLLTEPSAP
jgi:hypothetical protein